MGSLMCVVVLAVFVVILSEMVNMLFENTKIKFESIKLNAVYNRIQYLKKECF